MTVRFYRSTDAGAPQNTNAAGSLIAILDACLVNGYGSQLPAGWTKPFSGTNKAAYKQGAGSNGMYLRIDDVVASSGSFPLVRAYEDMTGIDTGTGAFPTTVQVPNGLGFQKSYNATAREWIVVADEKRFYAFLETIGTNNRDGHFFGDIISKKSGDAFNTLAIFNTPTAYDSTNFGIISNSYTTKQNGHYLARMHTQIGASLQCSKITPTNQSYLGSSSGIPSYPSAIDNALHIAPVYVTEDAGIRGRLPGLWNILHNKPFQHGDIITGTGDYAGKTFIAVTLYNGSHQCLVEISDTWS